MENDDRLDVNDLVGSTDFIHLRKNIGEWKTEMARERLEFYAAKLQALGMTDIDIQVMFSDLYYDAFCEYMANATFQRKNLLYR